MEEASRGILKNEPSHAFLGDYRGNDDKHSALGFS